MKVVFTKHTLEKIKAIKAEGWQLPKKRIIRTIKNPLWIGKTRFNQDTAMSLMDSQHIIRVVFREEDGIITVITFYIARRGRYESTL